ncbi:hypothetical protein ACFFGH_32180 [Lysobacter korlensis]|uniref:Mucin-associated surface protein n=1 Tax=Lysobacter korlensis TaxID=553636 RepID=A0ABV6S313_9GAMM
MRTTAGGPIASALLAGMLFLSGCASTPPPNPYASATAADLQQSVLHVTESAVGGDHAAALTRLQELEVATKVAHARGELSEARQDSILSAIALVRADLEALIAEATLKAEEEAKRKAEAEAREAAEAKAAEEAQKAAEAQAEREAAEAAARQQADDDNNGGGKGNDKNTDNDKNKGKNKNEGKGKGKNG